MKMTKTKTFHRRSIRLNAYDYSLPGRYFVTVCTNRGECLFGDVVNTEMRLNTTGKMVETVWSTLPKRFSFVELGEFAVMPNHFHGILVLNDTDDRRGESRIRPAGGGGGLQQGEHKVRPYGTQPNTVGRIVQAFKSLVTREYMQGVKNQGWPRFADRLWQRNYYEHIIRTDNDFNAVCEYLLLNPVKWAEDEENPLNLNPVNSSKIKLVDHLGRRNAVQY